MSFCKHCEGQRFDRAQVLRTLRDLRRAMRDARGGKKVDEALARAVKTVADLEIPHLEYEPPPASEMVH
ncbi:MAG: hypothetical protein AB7Q29_04955 [Vicinamibacterales bacterium]